jgi:nitrile hydratase
MDARGPALGAQVVARAWTDPAFMDRLLADGSAACREMGIEIEALKLVAVANDAQTHNVVVCTLCSCYPRNLLGLPPDWYKSRAYRSRTVREPRRVLAEFGLDLPDDVTLRVHDSTADMRYLVVPARPDWTEGWNADRLAGIVSRDSMIGVAVPQRP